MHPPTLLRRKVMNRFVERLNKGEVLVTDGATGTNLQKSGLSSGMHTEDWIFDQPQKILDLEKAFVAAGSDIILTCTFGGTRLRMKNARHGAEVVDLNKRAAELARKATSSHPDVLVGGSMGPLGQLLKPFGPVTYEEAKAAFAEQAAALAEGGVDLLVIETHFALEEADAAYEGARSVTDLPIVVSFSYDRGSRTMMGVKPAEVIKKYRTKGASLVGANCGTTLENMEMVIKEYGAAETGFPLWAKPNAGMPHLVGAQACYDVSPELMAEFAVKYVESGAIIVGGCCGSTPEHVAAIVKAVK
jgi:5-methyltetrahydrofolate--homocysteine methyltransferase